MSCPSDDELVGMLEHALEPTALQGLVVHVDSCPDCRKTVAALAVGTGTAGSAATLPASGMMSASTLLTSQVINERYEIASVLGAGGMGTVYLAHDRRLARHVALKLHRGSAEPERLRREAIAMAQLDHPNVVGVYEVGETMGRDFVAMEYVRGTTLAGWLAARPRTWRATINMLVAAGDGLAAAHAIGLVHRDFKPANVLVGDDGRPRVSDFGLVGGNVSEAVGDDQLGDALTQTGAAVGTPAYMAPEQFTGEPIDARADQFAFCVTAWEALAGERPFAGETINQLRAATAANALRPGWRGRRRLRRVLARGLAANPADRYPDLPTLLAALRRAARRRRERVMFATGLAIAALTIAAVVAMPVLHAAHRDAQLDARCDAEAAAVRAVVDVPAIARARAAFAAPGRESSAALVRRATTVLAADADRLALAADHSCRLGPTAEFAAARTACLNDARTQIADLMTQLASGDDGAARHGVDVAWSLAGLAPCADVRSMPSVSRALPAERALLTKVTGQLDVGSDPALAAVLEPVRAAAVARGDYDTAREALVLIGQALSQSDPPRADAALHDAFAAAEAAGNDDAAVAIAVNMVQLEGDGMHDRAASARSAALANAKLARMGGGRGTLVGPLLATEALAATDAGDNITAELEMRIGLAVTIATYGPVHPQVSRVELAMTHPLIAIGEYAAAIDAAHAALAIEREITGPDEISDYAAQGLLFLGQAEEGAGQLDAARADLEHAREVFAKLPDPGARWIGGFDVDLALGAVALDAGDWRTARDAQRRARELAQANGGDDSFGVALSDLDLASSDLLAGDPAASLVDATAALAIQGRDLGAENPQLTTAETRIARAKVALHRAADAIPDGERAVKLAMAAGNRADLADAQLALADALWDGGGDRRRAHDLVVAAAAAKPAPKNAAAWLASHPTP